MAMAALRYFIGRIRRPFIVVASKQSDLPVGLHITECGLYIKFKIDKPLETLKGGTILFNRF